ncbi:MAG: hypothetical protein H7175_24735 [Burkholderiales bacterium]|nr:hypothetical protein [Anaerolineae bacterium]
MRQAHSYSVTYLWLLAILCVVLAGCGSGAVQFAATPLPPDLSPLQYQHPSGAFSVTLPRTWTVYEQNTTTLATAAFTPPNEDEPLLLFAVMNIGTAVDVNALVDLIQQYQTQVRPDVERYTEQDRQAMGDGSWRLTGLRSVAGGTTQQVNTFIQQSGALIGMSETILPNNPNAGRIAELQGIVNSYTINPAAQLQPAELSALAAATSSGLSIVHVSTWKTPSGVFFITGEVANYGDATAVNLPVRAVLETTDGLGVAEAVDTTMGLGIPPGGFAPFSLRFGQGQPPLTIGYTLALGGENWMPDPDVILYGAESLEWSDESDFDEFNRLVISGTVTNISEMPLERLRAVATVFDTRQNVIAAGFSDLSTSSLAAGASAEFQVIIPEIGGEPSQYIVNIQGAAE